MDGTNHFLALFDTRFHVRDVSLRFFIGAIVDFAFTHNTQSLLGVELALSDMARSGATSRHLKKTFPVSRFR